MKLLLTLLFLPLIARAQAEATRESKPSLRIQFAVDGTPHPGPAEIIRKTPVELQVKPTEGGEIRWYQLIPDTRRFYKNANHPWEPQAYQWVGFGKIDCLRREVEAWRGEWKVTPTPEVLGYPDAGDFYHPAIGSFWFEVEVLKDGKLLRSPGLAENTDRGMNTSVFRLSIREDDTLAGWLTSYFNVPGLFGCIPWQSDNYIGVDCADALVAAWCKWKKRPMNKDWNVAGIVAEWPKVFQGNLENAQLEWGKDVDRGDYIAVQYAPGKQYQHIGALYADGNGNGKLDEEDLVMHCGPEALQVQPLTVGSFGGTVAVIRATKR